MSALPVVEEYIVNVGDCSDNTLDIIRGIDDPRIKIIQTTWNPSKFVKGATNADQTNIALDKCRFPWCLYLQADEVIHENDHEKIIHSMQKYNERDDVDGLLFHYNHFWGDYNRVHRAHNWYSREIRAIKNSRNIRSWQSAQSFRRNGEKICVADCGAFIYHYGWVRHPLVMRKKSIALESLHHNKEWVEKKHPDKEKPWDYGPLGKVPLFRGTHPAVMQERIASKSWKAEDFSDPDNPPNHRHLRLLNRLLSATEKLIGRKIGDFKNYILVK